MPIVAMQNVDLQIQLADGFHHGAAEENITLAIVAIIFTSLLIELRPVEVIVLFDEVNRNLLSDVFVFGLADDFRLADWRFPIFVQRRFDSTSGLEGGQSEFDRSRFCCR